MQLKNIQAKVKIFPKDPLMNHIGNMAIGCSNQPKIGVYFFSHTEFLYLFTFQYSKEFRLVRSEEHFLNWLTRVLFFLMKSANCPCIYRRNSFKYWKVKRYRNSV